LEEQEHEKEQERGDSFSHKAVETCGVFHSQFKSCLKILASDLVVIIAEALKGLSPLQLQLVCVLHIVLP
jgi:hypothetical protein